MKFTLFIQRTDLPQVPPVYMVEDPEDQTEMGLPRARQIALVMLEEYIKGYGLRGKSVSKARREAASLSPGHYVQLDNLQIALQMEGGITLDA
jgi:hypothetical protein